MILLVDDQADVRLMLSYFLEDEGVAFEAVASGEEALERASRAAYDLILLDQRMTPGLTGIEAAERLRAVGVTTPILLYSTFLDPAVEGRARELGLETVDKGEPDELMHAVRIALAAADQ